MEIEINDSNFKKEVLEESLHVLVDFWATWCGPCLRMAPIIEEISKEYQGKIKVCKLNVDDAPKTASHYDIMSIPTLAIFKNGKVVGKLIEVVSKAELEAAIRSHLD